MPSFCFLLRAPAGWRGALLGMLVLLARPVVAQTLHNGGTTLYVGPGVAFYVGGNFSQATGATLQSAGTVRVTGNVQTATGSTLTLSAGELEVGGDVTNAATTTAPATTLRLTGTTNQTVDMGGAPVGQLIVNKTTAAGNRVDLPTTLTVNTGLTLTAGLVRTAPTAAVVLPVGATLTGGEAAGRYVQGNLRVTRTAVNGTTAVDFGNGLTLSPGGNTLGTVTVNRAAGLQLSGTTYAPNPTVPAGKTIDRIWTLTPQTQPAAGQPATLTLTWLPDDDNGLTATDRAQARGWLRIPPATTWTGLGAYQDATVRTLTTPAATLADWTVGTAPRTTSPPTALALSSTSVNENTGPNAVVGTLTSTDPDVGDTFTYTLVGGAGSADNALVNISGNQLRITASPNFDTKVSYAVRLRTTDGDGFFFEQAFLLTVNDLPPLGVLTALSASLGLPGTTLTLTGTNLAGATSVSFNGVTTTAISGNTATSLTVTVPPGATSGLVVVTTGGGASNGLAFAVGTYVAVTFSGYNADVVAEGTGTATSRTTSSFDGPPNTALVAAGYSTGAATTTRGLPASGLLTSTGTGIPYQLAPYTGNNSVRMAATGAYPLTLTAAVPALTLSLLAASGDAISTVTVTVNFSDGTTQVFPNLNVANWLGGTPFAAQGLGRVARATNALDNSTTDPRLYEVALALSAANQNKLVTSISCNKTSTAGVLNVLAVSRLAPTPALASLTPVSGLVGTVVTLTGTGFGADATVRFNGTPATAVTVNSGTSITATAPVGTTTGPVTVTTAGGTSNGVTFTLETNQAPTNINLSNSSIAENTGANAVVGTLSATDANASDTFTYALVSGTGATDNALVNLSGSLLRITASPDFETKASYAVRVRATDAGGLIIEKAFTLTIINVLEPPTLSALSATTGPGGGGLTLTGTNFTGATAVSFNGLATTAFTVNSATSITATIPTSATSGNVTVTAPDGTSNGLPFLVSSGLPLTVTGFNNDVVAEGTGSASSRTTSAFDGNSYALIAAGYSNGTTTTTRGLPSNGVLTGSSGMPFQLAPYNGPNTLLIYAVADHSVFVNNAGPIDRVAVLLASSGLMITVDITVVFTDNSSQTFAAQAAPNWSDPTSPTSIVGLGYVNYNTNAINNSLSTARLYERVLVLSNVNKGKVLSKVTFKPTSYTGRFIFVMAISAKATLALNSLSATSGAPGASLTLNGVNLGGATSVSFNGVATTAITTNSATGLTVLVPAGAGSGLVTVTTPLGTSNGLSFTVIANQAPTALALSNSSVAENTGANAVVGTLNTTDPNVGNTFTYSLVSGTGSADNALVSISGNTLLITASPDFEAKPSYAVRVRTTDQGGLFFEQALTLTVINVNEAPTLNAQVRSVAENTANGTAVGAALTATDPDAGTTLSYSLIGGNTTGAFALNAATGQLTVANAAALDFETTPVFTLTVQVSDGALTASNALTVNLTNVNEAPTLSAQTRSVAENSANGTLVGAPLIATDPDAGTTLTYTLLSGNTNGAFALSAATGQLTVANAAAVGSGAPSPFTLTVRVSDGTLTASNTVTVNLTDANDAPVFVAQTRAVAEDAAVGTLLGAPLTATDPDPGTVLAYAITAGNGAGLFALDAATGQLRLVGALDFEATPGYTLTVRVTDGFLTASALVTINVTNVNEAPRLPVGLAFALPENTAAGTAVGAITGTDPDAGTVLTYSITRGNPGGAFAISSTTGALTVATAAALDFETTPVFTLTVRVSDGALTDTAYVSVALSNVNEAPTALTLSNSTVAENTGPLVVVGALSPADPDAGDTFTLALVSGAGATDNALVDLNGTDLRLLASPDFEAKATYAVRVRVTDAAGLFTEQAFTVLIRDVNEAPTNLALSNTTVAENAGANAPVGTLRVVTPGLSGPFTYTLAAGAGAADNSLMNIAGNALRLSASVDFETRDTLAVRVRATAPSGAWVEQAFRLAVTNVNEAPTAIALDNATVAENTGLNAAVGNLGAVDPDAGDQHTFTLVSGAGATDNALVNIDGTQLRITASPDFETKASYAVRVRATDAAGLFTEQTFTLTVTNEVEILLLNNTTVAENTGANAPVGNLSVAPGGFSGPYLYALVSGNGDTDNALANLNGTQLRLTASPDFETQNSYAVRVRVTGTGGAAVEQAFVLQVTNVNEAPTALALDSTYVTENAGTNAVVGTLSTTDPDEANAFTYTLVSGTGATDNALANINGDQLRITASPDFETRSSYAVRVRTTDQGGLFTEQAFTLTVRDVFEPPTNVLLSNNTVAENTGPNVVVGTLSVPVPGTHTYALVAGLGDTDNGLVNLNGNQLRITTSPDFDTRSYYEVRVRATKGVTVVEQAFLLTVTNVNEAPTEISLDNATVAENGAPNAVVGMLLGLDPDSEDVLTYSLVPGAGATDNGLVSLTGNQLRLTAPADFETKPTYAVRVRATDQGGLWLEKTLTLTVLDVNEQPTALALSATVVAENTGPNAVVGLLLPTDPDAGETFTYALVSGFGDGDNALLNLVGNQLRVTASPDFETKASYAVRLRATDHDGLSVEQFFLLTVTDVNEAPTALSLSNTTVAENTGANAVVGQLNTTDPDAANTFTYSLVSGAGSADNALVNISSSQLRLTASPDFETKNSYAVRIRTTDAGGLFLERAFTISITNVNEAPSLAAQTRSIADNSAIGTPVGAPVMGTDPDAGTTLVYTITGGNTGGAFGINASTGQLSVLGALNFATTPSYALTVQVSDGTLTASATVTVNVIAVPSLTSLSPSSGPVGAGITLTGTNLTGATSVVFNGTVATSFTVGSATSITVTVPAGATTGLVTVTTPNGTSNGRVFTVTPAITALSTLLGPEGTPMVLTGTSLTGASAVSFNGTAAAFTVQSDTRITVNVPVGATTGNVTVTTAAGPSNIVVFQVLPIFAGTPNQCQTTAPVVSTGAGQWLYLRHAVTGELVAALNDQGIALGTVSAELLRNTGPVRTDQRGREYLDRNWHLTAQNRFAGQAVLVRFYALNSELTRFIAANDNDGNDVTSLSGLRLTQYDGNNEDCQLTNNAAGTYRLLTPNATQALAGAAWFSLETTVRDHFSEFYFNGGATPLPVELVHFGAERRSPNRVAIAWRTASERHSAYFMVERSADGQTFAAVGEAVPAAGTSHQMLAYAWTDATAPATALYYRLRQVDDDGITQWSNTVRVGPMAGPLEPLAVWPNPVSGGGTVCVTGCPANLPVTVFDLTGRHVATMVADPNGTATMTVRTLATGVYTLRTPDGRTARLVVE